MEYNELKPKTSNGLALLVILTAAMLLSVGMIVFGAIIVEKTAIAGAPLIVVGIAYACLVGPFLYNGLKILKPNEALVLTLFGKYIGTLRGEGYYYVNPFASAVNPAYAPASRPAENRSAASTGTVTGPTSRKISLKAMTLDNKKQKINDLLGNPIEIGIVVIWRVVNAAKAVFNVDNYMEYLSIQCDSAIRNIVRLYTYDVSRDGDEKSLRSSSQEIGDKLKSEIQLKADIAGLEIIEARITHLAYAPEIAAAMLQRQQASAVIDARQMIVEGAVGMVEMALAKLSEKSIVNLDEERKAAMVSNLLVVLCGNKDAQPVVNSGSLY